MLPRMCRPKRVSTLQISDEEVISGFLVSTLLLSHITFTFTARVWL